MCVPARNVCVCYGLWNPPTASLPNVFRHPGLPVGGKHSVFHFIHHHVCSFLLVSLIWQPARASSLRRRGWWKKKLQYFEFGLQYLVQPLGVNPTYSTFNGRNFVKKVPFVVCWRPVVLLCSGTSVEVKSFQLEDRYSNCKHISTENSNYRM